MDSAVANLTSEGDKVAVVSAGAFGERWFAICEQYGLEVQRLSYEWGEVPSPDEVGAAVARERGACGLLHAFRDLDRRRSRRAGTQGGGR